MSARSGRKLLDLVDEYGASTRASCSSDYRSVNRLTFAISSANAKQIDEIAYCRQACSQAARLRAPAPRAGCSHDRGRAQLWGAGSWFVPPHRTHSLAQVAVAKPPFQK